MGTECSTMEVMELEMSMVRKQFWTDKRVLVTGCSGFKGSWLSIWLCDLGADVYGIALEPESNPSLFNLTRLRERIKFTELDVRNSKALTQCVDEIRPQIVFHLAAQPIVRLSYKNPVQTFTTNLIGTLNLYEAIRFTDSVKTVINVTTDKVYKNYEWEWGYRENEALGGYDPYSASKACSEILTESYRRSFFNQEGVNIATARAGNVIGGGDWSDDRLIPDVLRSLENRGQVLIRNPNSIRPWQHVLESLSGYLILAQNLHQNKVDFSGAWNFGPDESDAKPVKDVVERICQEWGAEACWNIQPGNHPHEANYLKLDISKSRAKLKWKPKWNLNKAVALTVSWQKKFLLGADSYQLCLNQLNEYVNETS